MAIAAKIAKTRRHHLHELSTRLVLENKWIMVGDVNGQPLVAEISAFEDAEDIKAALCIKRNSAGKRVFPNTGSMPQHRSQGRQD